jgi:uncharacterized protein (TIGR03000 family)
MKRVLIFLTSLAVLALFQGQALAQRGGHGGHGGGVGGIHGGHGMGSFHGGFNHNHVVVVGGFYGGLYAPYRYGYGSYYGYPYSYGYGYGPGYLPSGGIIYSSYDRMYPPLDPYQQPLIDQTSDYASVQITVPSATAEIWFDGKKTTSQGLRRDFVTPELTPGKSFTYEVRAKWTENNQEFDQTKTLTVMAGRRTVFAFSSSELLPPPK